MPKIKNVRFGSEADMCAAPTHVRFSPNSDRKSGHSGGLRQISARKIDPAFNFRSQVEGRIRRRRGGSGHFVGLETDDGALMHVTQKATCFISVDQ